MPLSRVKLAGYPVSEIVSVKIDGVAVDPAGYRLDGRRYLTRMDDPGPPVVRNAWPGCQNLALNDDQPGTFSVTYKWGASPPDLGKRAACEIACQLFIACGGDTSNCKLPAGVTRITRQGVTIDRGLLANWLDPKTGTGLVHVDLFLQSFWRGARGGRRPLVWSPDTQQYPMRTG